MDDRRRDDGNYYGPPSQHNDRSRSRDDDHNDGGRPSSRKKTRTCSTGDKDDRGPIQREWPPAFESSGASYVFDTRSGMFYEPSSNFFYDPKTKLYYSNKKQQYFQFVMGSKNKFQPIGGQQVSQSVSVEESNGAVVDKDAVEPMPNEGNAQKKTMPEARIDETRHEKAEVKPKIAISLKTPALPSKDNAAKKTLSEVAAIEKNKLIEQNMIARKEFSSSAPDTATASIPQSHKQHENDMDKWSERVKEMRSEDSPNASAAVVKEKQSATIASTPKIVKTASGQPICVLCKRKFANVEKCKFLQSA